MDWRLAESIRTLRAEVDLVWPKRSKLSDGTIGNASHASRSSDHNPWVRDAKGQPVVTAIDITHDPEHGVDAPTLAEHFRAMGKAGDKRIKYVISKRRIASNSFSAADRAKGRKPWEWWPYTGINAHLHHVHLSVSSVQKDYDSVAPWGFVPVKPKPTPKPVVVVEEKGEDAELDLDSKLKLGPGTAGILGRTEISVREALDWTVGNAVNNEKLAREARDRVIQLQRDFAQLKALLLKPPA